MQGRNSNEQEIKGFNQYTGLASLKVLAINPTAEEIRKLNNIPDTTDIKEPQYTNIIFKDGDLPQSKVVFFLGNEQDVIQSNGSIKKENISVRAEFFVSDREYITTTGKKKMINKVAAEQWGDVNAGGLEEVERKSEDTTQNETYRNILKDFLKNKPVHNAKEGELELLKFVRSWLAISPNEEGNFDNFDKIANGDVTELRNYMTKFPTNEVVGLLYVREKDDKTYQSIYAKLFTSMNYFIKFKNNVIKMFNNAINEQYGEVKGNFQKSFDLKVYNPTVSIDTPDSSAVAPKSDFV